MSWTDREPPVPTSTRSRATSAHRPSRISTPRRRSTAGILAGAASSSVGTSASSSEALGGAAAGATVAADGDRLRGGRSAPARRSRSGGLRVTRTEGRRQGDGARDRGSGRGQAGRWPGIGQVEQDARELGTDEDRGRRPGIGERETRAATGEPAEPRRGRRIGQTVIGQDGLDVARPDQPEAEAETARSNRREEARLLVRAEEDGHAGRRLLERLEQGRLGVLVHPVGTLDDRHAGAALDRHQLQLDDEILDAPELRLGATDDHLATRPGRREAVQVRMAPVLDQPARPAGATRPLVERSRAEQAGRDVEGQGRLADPVGADQQDGLGHGAPDHRGRRAERGGLPPGPGAIHDLVGQTGSAGAVVLRVVRRFGAASPPSPVALADAGDALAAAGLRVARGLAGALAGALAAPSAEPARPASSAPADPAPSAADAADEDARVARGLAGALASPSRRGLAGGTRLGRRP